MQVYLDNSATTRPCDAAVEAMVHSMREDYYNPSALYAPAMRAEQALKQSAQAIAAALDTDPRHVLFTSGGTESDNLAILGYMQLSRDGGEILYSAAEHAAVRMACQEAAARYGCTAREIPLTGDGLVDLEALEGMLSEQTRMICVMQVCNETGVIMPIAEICELRKRLAPKAVIHVDGVQGFLREPFSMRRLPVDSYAISAHKFHGPKGVGALVWREGFRFKPQMVGGGQQNDRRSGTENTVGIAGMGAAVSAYPGEAREQMRRLKKLLVDTLHEALPQMAVVGLPAEDQRSAGHILSVAFPPVRAETLLHALEMDGICVGTGSACSSKKGKHSLVLTAMKLSNAIMEGAIRISLCPENTEEEILYTAQRIIHHVEMLKRFVRR
ncbi:MAG: cysteine desulfurase [Clostridiales bacterium]|nr:cysteine desulfurase [Clostridiales bacterium]